MRISDWSSDVCSSDLVDIQNGNVARPSPRSLERCSETLYAQYSKVIYRDAALRGWLGDYAGGLLISDLDNEAARFDLMKLIQAEPGKREYPSSQFGHYALAHSFAAYAETPEKLDIPHEVLMALPEIPHANSTSVLSGKSWSVSGAYRGP